MIRFIDLFVIYITNVALLPLTSISVRVHFAFITLLLLFSISRKSIKFRKKQFSDFPEIFLAKTDIKNIEEGRKEEEEEQKVPPIRFSPTKLKQTGRKFYLLHFLFSLQYFFFVFFNVYFRLFLHLI